MQRHRIPRKSKRRHPCYADREKSLKTVGFESYREYLESDLWQMVRTMAFEKHGNKCVHCGMRATALHHAFYTADVLLGVELDALHPVCNSCHEQAEWLDNGDKATLRQANERLGIDKPMRIVGKRIKSRMKEIRPWKICPSCRKKKIGKDDLECRKCFRKREDTDPELKRARLERQEEKRLANETQQKERAVARVAELKETEDTITAALDKAHVPWLSVQRHSSIQFRFHDSRESGKLVAKYLASTKKLWILGIKKYKSGIEPKDVVAAVLHYRRHVLLTNNAT